MPIYKEKMKGFDMLGIDQAELEWICILPDRCSTGTVGQALFCKIDSFHHQKKRRADNCDEVAIMEPYFFFLKKRDKGVNLRSRPWAIDSHIMNAATRC